MPRVGVAGLTVPVAIGFRARLLGLAGLDRGAAGAGLLIPRCSGIHTFGMRFALDLLFLDVSGEVVAIRACVPPRRLASCRGAAAVLELPAGRPHRAAIGSEGGGSTDRGPGIWDR